MNLKSILSDYSHNSNLRGWADRLASAYFAFASGDEFSGFNTLYNVLLKNYSYSEIVDAFEESLPDVLHNNGVSLEQVGSYLEGFIREVSNKASDSFKDGKLFDAATLTYTSTDEEQLEAYEYLLGHLQPLYYPMFQGELDDLVHDFWEWLNVPNSYAENVKDLRNVPSGVKVWAIRWLQNLNKYKRHDTVLSARFKEELNRAAGNIDLGDYLDEAYNRVFNFTEKELVSFIRKFKELMKVDKGLGYALSPHQIEMFKPLFEKAQFLLNEVRTTDCKLVAFPQYTQLKDEEEVVTLSKPLVDLLGTLFYEVEGSDLKEPIQDTGSEYYNEQLEGLYEELESEDYKDGLISDSNILDEIGYYLHKLKKL